MGVLLVLDHVELTVAPGQEASVELQLRNAGAVVDQFTLELVGDSQSWAEITPKIVNLFPDSGGTAQLVFKPPRGSDVLAGEIPFAVKVMSREDPEGSVVEEGLVTVEPFTEVTAEIVPHGSRGAFRGRHKLAVDNRGNVPTPVDVQLLDPKNELDLKIRPARQVLQPGTATLFPVKAAPKKRFLHGPQKTHPFQALVTGEGFEPVTADAAMVQEQILPKWLPGLLAAVFALGVTLGILWFTVLKPSLRTEAQNAANQQTAGLTAGVSAAQSAASAANSQAAKAKDSVDKTDQQLVAEHLLPSPGSSVTPSPNNSAPGGGANGNGNSNGTGTGGGGNGGSATPSPAPGADQVSISIPGTAAPNPGHFQTFSTSPQSKTLLISDVLISNAAGDHGFVQLEITSGGASTPILTLNMDDFVSQDEHFIQPIAVRAGDTVTLAVDCTNTSADCQPFAYLSATMP